MTSEFKNYLLIERGISPRQSQEYVYTIARFKSQYPESTKETIQSFYISYLNGGYSKSTIRNISFALNHYSAYLGIDLKIKPPKKNKTKVKYLSKKDIYAVLSQITSCRDMCIYLLMAQGGLRVGEVCKLNLDDLFFKPDDGYILLKDTKNGEDWKVYLMPDTISIIQDYISKERNNNALNNALFLTKNDTRMSNRLIEKFIKKAGEQVNIKVYPHLLRHTCATQMRINGADIDTIKNQLRHRNYETTKIYIHAVDEVQKINYKKYCFSLDDLPNPNNVSLPIK